MRHRHIKLISVFSELSSLPSSVKIIGFLIFVYYLGWSIVSPFFPLYLDSILSNYTEIGIIMGLVYILCFFWFLPLGELSDKVSKRFMIIITLFLYLPMGYILLSLKNFLHFVLFRFYHSFLSSSIWLNTEALVRQHSPKKKTSESLGFFDISWVLSLVIGSALSGFLFMKFGFSIIWFITVFSFFGLLVSFSIKDKKIKGFWSSTKEIIIKDKIFKKEIIDFSKNKELIKFSVLSFFIYFCISFLFMLLPLFSSKLGATPIQIGLLFSLFFLPRLSEGYFSVLADKFGKRIILMKGLFFSFVFFFLMFFVENLAFLFLIAFLLSFLGFSVVLPPLLGRTTELMPKKNIGEMTGMIGSLSNLGRGISPIVAGLIADFFGLRYVFLLGSFISLALLIYSFKLKF